MLGSRVAILGSKYAPETVRYVSRMTVKPSASRIMAIDRLVVRPLKAGPIFGKLDRLWLHAAHDAQAARLDLITGEVLSENGSLTFTTDRGYAGDGSTGYLRGAAQWNKYPRYALDDAHLGVWIRGGTDAAANKAAVGTLSGSSAANLRPRVVSGNCTINMNQASNTDMGLSHGTVIGHFIGTRRGAADIEAYHNGASLGTATTASGSVSSSTLATHSHNGGIFSDFELSETHLGSGLSNGDAASLYAILLAYNQEVGAA